MKFVVLHHTGFGEAHFDFMLERARGKPLQTFRAPHWPIQLGDILEEINDHRPEYLNYEGVVSGNRGTVSRVESGEILARTRNGVFLEITLQLTATRLELRLENEIASRRWLAQFALLTPIVR